MVDLSKLKIEIDSSAVTQAKEALDQLTESAIKAKAALAELGLVIVATQE